MMRVSIVITSLNEGELLRQTVDNHLARLPRDGEIVVVDDGSTDGSADFLNNAYDGVTLLRPTERLGVARARNFGAEHAQGDVLVFSDAHVLVPPNWCDPLLDVLRRPEAGAVAPAISMMRPATDGSTGYGQKFRDATLAVEWLGQQSSSPYPAPLLCGCFLALRHDLFREIGGFDAGMVLWGAEDSELSIRLWTLGYECWVAPQVDVEHAFRAQFPYEVKWEPVLHNRLRLATVHFGPDRLRKVVERLKQYDEFAAASARLLAGDLGARVSKMRGARQFDDEWFFRKFDRELRSDLSDPNALPVPFQRPSPAKVSVPGGGQVSACLLSWKRPENLPAIVRTLRHLEFIDEILIWNNNPDVRLEFTDSNTRVLESSENQGCYGRFLCAAQARNPVVYVQDDDALNRDVAGLYRQFLRDPASIAHALAPTHWGQRRRHVYGNSQAALVGWGAFFQKECLSVLDQLPAPVREDALFRREADKFFTLLLGRKHHAVAGDIEHLDGHSTPGIALWRDASHQQLAARATSQALGLLRLKNGSALPWNVVIPCHNYGRYLADAVESVLANDADFEIRIVDDASSDETSEVAAELARLYPNVKCVRNDSKRGPGFSRNRGIEAVDSTFVVLLDADDRIGPNYLFEAARVLTNGADIVNPDANLFGAVEDRWIVPESTTLRMLLDRNSVHYCSAFRRELWLQAGGIDEDMPCWMDYEFWIRAAAAGARIEGLHGNHFFYRQHSGNLTATAKTMERELRGYLRSKHAGLFESFGMAAGQTR
jgi:glycosyltransferase involved in cell wall biosynthesis